MQRPDGMRPFLVVHATRGGRTRLIAERIVDRLRVLAHESELRDARSEPLSPLQWYAAVTLAADVQLGHHDRQMVRFVRAHRHELAQVPTLLLSVSLSDPAAADPGRCDHDRTQAAGATRAALDEFVLETGWLPGNTVPIALRRGGTGRGVVFADWATLNVAVDALVREAVQRGRGVPPPSEEALFRTALEGAVLAP